MTAYYNEYDKNAAAWLRELIDIGLIAEGRVDERSITEVEANDIGRTNRVHWFAGIGGWDYALKLAGWPTDRPVWTASLPCQPFSLAGKGLGKNDERHLLPHFLELVRECRPDIIFGEQVEGAIRHGWLDDLQTTMEAEGYAVGHCVLGAHSVGAPHIRQRLYWIANSKRGKQIKPLCREARRMGRVKQSFPWNRTWKSALSEFRILDDGFSRNVDACDAARNAIVPQVAAEFIKAVMELI